MWYLTLFNVRDIISKLIKKNLFHLLLVSVLLNYQNPFNMILFITSFAESLFQHVLINVKDVVSQIISVKTA